MPASCEIFNGPLDIDIPYVRELMAYDCLCPASCTFAKNDVGQIGLYVPPSPLHWSRQGEWPWVLRNAELQPHHRVLDAGSGWSVLKFALAKRCCHVVCAEKDAHSLYTAQRSIEGMGFADRIMQVKSDVRDLPFPDNWFDRVVCVSVIEHMPCGWIDATRELMRVLKPGGRLLLTMDVRISGPELDDFYLDVEGSKQMMSLMQCDMPVKPGRLMGSKQCNDQIEVVVLMIRYDKPE